MLFVTENYILISYRYSSNTIIMVVVIIIVTIFIFNININVTLLKLQMFFQIIRDGSRAAATSKMKSFVIIVNGFQLLTITIKPTILIVATVLDLPLNHIPLKPNNPPHIHKILLGQGNCICDLKKILLQMLYLNVIFRSVFNNELN